MPYDPTLPANNAPNSSAQMRAQLNGLKDLIDAVPAGPPGQNGSDGASLTGAVVDGTNTLNPGDAAQASVSWDGANVRFTFALPRGFDGTNGINGSDGVPGVMGPPGPPFSNFVIDSVSTLNPADPATVQTSFDGTNVHFAFGIPRGFTGNDGSTGAQGPQGPQGPPFAQLVVDSVTTLDPSNPAAVNLSFDGTNIHFQFAIPRGYPGNDGGSGPQGPPGEVTTMQLNSAINGTSNNSNAVNTLAMTVSDPPTQGEVQAIASKLDELILALRR